MIAAEDFVISKETLASAKISAQELTLELAVYLYEKGRLTLAQAKHLARLDQISFQKELAKRNVFIRISEDDLLKDAENLGINL